MTALLTTNAAAVFNHLFIDIFVAHSGLSVTDTLLIKCFVQTKVGHDRSNNCIIQQFAAFFHIAAIDVQDIRSKVFRYFLFSLQSNTKHKE